MDKTKLDYAATLWVFYYLDFDGYGIDFKIEGFFSRARVLLSVFLLPLQHNNSIAIRRPVDE